MSRGYADWFYNESIILNTLSVYCGLLIGGAFLYPQPFVVSMPDSPLSDNAVSFVAKNSRLLASEVEDALETVQAAAGERLYQWYYNAWYRGEQNVLTEMDRDVVAFAFDEVSWADVVDDKLDSDEVSAAILAHQYHARNVIGAGVVHEMAGQPPRSPLFVRKPDAWQDGEASAALKLIQLFKFGCTPPEVIDYWFVEVMGYDREDVAQFRGVYRPAINKNLRNAKEKVGDYEGSEWFNAEENIRFVPLDELPDDSGAFEDTGDAFETYSVDSTTDT